MMIKLPNIVKIFFMLIFLWVINCSLIFEPDPAGETVIVLTFDDGHESIYSAAFPIMQQYHFTGTCYVPVETFNAPNSLTFAQMQEMEASGWETGGHGVTHANLVDLSQNEVEYQVSECWQFLRRHHLAHNSFALPSGHANQLVMGVIRQYFENCRTSEDVKHRRPVDPYALGYYFVTDHTTVADIKSRILRGIINNECLVIIGFHKITASNENVVGSITRDDFSEVLEFISQRRLGVMTVSQALSYVSQ